MGGGNVRGSKLLTLMNDLLGNGYFLRGEKYLLTKLKETKETKFHKINRVLKYFHAMCIV